MSDEKATDAAPMLRHEDKEGISVVTIQRTRLSDEDNLEEFGQTINDILAASGSRRLVVDMSRLQYMSSAALGKLITMHRSLARNGGRMLLCGVSAALNEIIVATRLQSLFEIADDRTSAIANVGT